VESGRRIDFAPLRRAATPPPSQALPPPPWRAAGYRRGLARLRDASSIGAVVDVMAAGEDRMTRSSSPWTKRAFL